MADFDAPSGPPPPKVPEGWIARWNDQYKEWFYVNKYTKKSQWDRPTEPVYPPHDDDAPPGPPPAYRPGSGPAPTDSKTNPFAHGASATPSHTGASSSSTEDEDARLARQLQAEEDARARGSSSGGGGSASSYLSGSPAPGASSAYPEQLPPRPGDAAGKDRGLFGKLFGKNKQQGYAPQQQPYGYNSPPPPQQYGGYRPPQPQYGYGPPPGQYYQQGPPPGGYYPQQGYAPQQQQYGRPSGGGGGMGMMGGAALGLGAGLIGGALIENAIDDHDQQEYDQGYQAGQDDGGGGGGDFDDGGGGGDF